MKTSRELALHILSRIESDAAYINIILDAEFRKVPSLDPRDRALVTELVYGVIRWQKTLDWYLDQVCQKPMQKTHPLLRHILRVGAYQLLMLDKIPPSAAVNESVKLAGKYAKTLKLPARTAKGFVNAALRRLQREQQTLQTPDSVSDDVTRLTYRYSFPKWMITRWIQRLGAEKTEEICRIHNTPAPLNLRINPLKTSLADVRQHLTKHAQTLTPLPEKLLGLAVSGIPPISELFCYQNGWCTVQNASSMLIAMILDPQPGEHILDVCAGAGIKTTHIAELMQNRGRITAVDVHEGKLQQLRKNCRRLGISMVTAIAADMTHSPPPDISEQNYDRVLIDAPCTGLGVLRKHPEAKWTTREADIQGLQQVQRTLLEQIVPYIRPEGGILVYSTCTTEPEENEDIILKFLDIHPQFHIQSLTSSLPQELHHDISSEGFLRIEPPQGYFDGFFCAKLLRKI